MKKPKKLNQCRKCGVELSWKENRDGTLCRICERQEFEKDMQFLDNHGDAHRNGQGWARR